jgi:hypothetical protein
MLKEVLLAIYEREIEKVKREVELYRDDELMWVVREEIPNSAGNLTLHLVGNLNHFFGAVLDKNDYLRDRPSEFSRSNVPRAELIEQLEAAKAVVRTALGNLSADALAGNYPEEFNGETVKTDFMLVSLLAHLSYHLGQINYHRRLIG